MSLILGKHKGPLYVLLSSAVPIKTEGKRASLVMKRSYLGIMNNIASQISGKKEVIGRKITVKCCFSVISLLAYFCFCFDWFRVDVIYPKSLARARHIFRNIISTTNLESAKSLSTVVAWEMETVLKSSPTATERVHVSVCCCCCCCCCCVFCFVLFMYQLITDYSFVLY